MSGTRKGISSDFSDEKKHFIFEQCFLNLLCERSTPNDCRNLFNYEFLTETLRLKQAEQTVNSQKLKLKSMATDYS